LEANFAENVCTQSFETQLPHKKTCRIGPGLWRTSKKEHKAKWFAELTFNELRRCRSELHTGRDRKRKLRIFEPSQAFDTPWLDR
jgi:hypothetical protein